MSAAWLAWRGVIMLSFDWLTPFVGKSWKSKAIMEKHAILKKFALTLVLASNSSNRYGRYGYQLCCSFLYKLLAESFIGSIPLKDGNF